MVYIPEKPTALMKQKKAKYRNKKVSAQGKNFDSIKERDRFFFLQDCQRRGVIRNLRCQVRFSIDVEGEHICDYIADFVYESVWNSVLTVTVVEDVKSKATKTDVYRLKNKLMKAVHGVEIREVFQPTLPI